jgi:hypothetical protein
MSQEVIPAIAGLDSEAIRAWPIGPASDLPPPFDERINLEPYIFDPETAWCFIGLVAGVALDVNE